MTPISPVLGVVLIIVCLIAQWGFARSHLDPGNLVTTAMGVAVAMILGQSYFSTRERLARKEREVAMLRDSGGPAALPGPDETIPPKASP
jgi:hypothetical protein